MPPSYLTPISSGAYALGFTACLLTLANSMSLASGRGMESDTYSVTASLEQAIAGFIDLTPPTLNPQEVGALLLTLCALFSGWLLAIGDRPTLPLLAGSVDGRAG